MKIDPALLALLDPLKTGQITAEKAEAAYRQMLDEEMRLRAELEAAHK